FLVLQIGLAILFVMKHRPRPVDYGWTLHNWQRAVSESLVITCGGFAIMVGIKTLVIRHAPEFYGTPLIDWSYWRGWPAVTSYLFVAPAQELIGRGFLQNSIERFLTGRHRSLLAVVLTALQFGVVHLHFSFWTGVVAMVSGLLFGTMF